MLRLLQSSVSRYGYKGDEQIDTMRERKGRRLSRSSLARAHSHVRVDLGTTRLLPLCLLPVLPRQQCHPGNVSKGDDADPHGPEDEDAARSGATRDERPLVREPGVDDVKGQGEHGDPENTVEVVLPRAGVPATLGLDVMDDEPKEPLDASKDKEGKTGSGMRSVEVGQHALVADEIDTIGDASHCNGEGNPEVDNPVNEEPLWDKGPCKASEEGSEGHQDTEGEGTKDGVSYDVHVGGREGSLRGAGHWATIAATSVAAAGGGSRGRGRGGERAGERRGEA